VIGQEHPRAKLLDSEVDQVLELVEAGFSFSQVAEKMGVTKSCVGHIVSGRRRCQTPAKLVSVSVTDEF
jgi:predicted transcriptional regulator